MKRGMMIAGGLALTIAGLSIGQPIEKTGACPTLTRTNFYNGFDLRAFNSLRVFTSGGSTGDWTGVRDTASNLASLRQNDGDNSNWPILPPVALRNAGLIQEPLTPQQSINCVMVPPGLKPQIIASELTPGPAGLNLPGMAYIMNFTFDEKGRAWVIEPRDYPYTHDSSGMPAGSGVSISGGVPSNRLAGKGRILILEDNNGDGAIDRYKVFYVGLALPTSIELVKNGVVVSVPPNVYYIARSASNPDTAEGTPTIVVSGMGSSDQNYDSHGQPNSLTRSIDNWVYGHTGYNGCGGTGTNIANAPNGSSRNNTSTGCGNGYSYRFKHALIGSDTSRFEIRSSGSANAHGLGFMEDGQLFKSAATGSQHIQHDVRPGTAALDVRFASGGTGNNDRTRLYSLTNDRYMWEGNNNTIAAAAGSGNVTYYSSGISAVSGSDFYTARLLPQKYWNRFQIACEGMSGLCNQDSLVENGSSWYSHRLYPGNRWPNIFASSDAWSAPMKARTAPDGSLWVLDFYNYIFLHNPANPATNGAYRHPLRYKTRSRIYRILPENGATDPVLNLTNATTSQLARTFFNSNYVWRLTAQRLLIERGYSAEIGNLMDSILTRRRQVDAVGLDAPVLHAIWTLHGLRQFEVNPTRWDPILKNLLLHPAWTVRRNALLAMPSTAASYEAIRDQCSVNDTHAHVRLQAFEALARTPASGTVIQSMDGLRIEPFTPVAGASLTDADSTRMTYLTAAFNAAGTSKVVTASGNARPGTCPAYLAEAPYQFTPVKGAVPFRFSQDVRFDIRQGGFALMNNDQLPSGELVVQDLRGKQVFRSVWNRSTLKWSNVEVRNLAYPLYFYSFRAYSGEKYNGRVALSSI